MSRHAVYALLLTSMLTSACGFQSKSKVLMPTSPSSVNTAAGSDSSASSGSSGSSSSASSSGGSVFAGTWFSSTMNGLPNISSCSDIKWQISNLTPTEVNGTVEATCGGAVTITADLTGKLNGEVIDLTAKGQAVGFGLTCGFSLTGTGTRQSTDAVELDYKGSTCIKPVSGTEILRRNSPAPA